MLIKFSPFSASGKLFCNELTSNNKILTQSLVHFSFFLFCFVFLVVFFGGGGESWGIGG